MRVFLGLLIGLLVWFGTVGHAFAERRVALVIGNSTYEKVGYLTNPVNDAAAIAKLLKDAGFDVVELQSNLGVSELRRAVRNFSQMVQNADIAVVYFAGHGIEVDGVNYLIPTDARLERDIDVEDEALSLERVLKIIEPARRLRLVILDACRDNPFTSSIKRTVASRAVGRGLARVEPDTSNTMIAFAAKAGSTASDGRATNSPFTAALLKHITTPGLDLRIAFGRVHDEVLDSTGRKQEPFMYGSLGGSFVSLVPEPTKIDAPTPSIQQVTPNVDTRADYEIAERVGTVEAWTYFLAVNPSGYYANLAHAQLAKLAAANVAAAELVRPVSPVRPAAPGTEPPKSADLAIARTTPAEPGVAFKYEPADGEVLSDPGLLREIRERLNALNFDPGPLEGGEAAQRSIREFEAGNDLPQTGQPTKGLLRKLRDVREPKLWGTFVYAKGTNKWGMAWGQPSRQQAVASARSSCGDAKKCSIELSFFGGECGFVRPFRRGLVDGCAK